MTAAVGRVPACLVVRGEASKEKAADAMDARRFGTARRTQAAGSAEPEAAGGLTAPELGATGGLAPPPEDPLSFGGRGGRPLTMSSIWSASMVSHSSSAVA